FFLFFTHAAPPAISTLSLHDALPISRVDRRQQLVEPLIGPLVGRKHLLARLAGQPFPLRRLRLAPLEQRRPYLRQSFMQPENVRSEEHTSELQSRENLVCRLLLEKKK